MNLKDLIESEKLEFKRELPKGEKLAREILAFANTRGGQIIIGYDEKTKTANGVAIDQRLEERIANIVNDLCEPHLTYYLSYQAVDLNTVLVIDVAEGPAKPYRLKHRSLEEGVFVRIGSTTRLADLETLQRLIREGKNIAFDSENVSSKTKLDLSLLAKFLERRAERLGAPQAKLTSVILEDLGLWREESPTIAGALLFLKNPQNVPELASSFIKAARFLGKEKGEFIDQAEISGPLPFQVDETVKFVLRNSRLSAKIEGTQRIDSPEYSSNIIRELITNAVIHRDYAISGTPIHVALYDDRLEVTSPGGLAGPVTTENIKDRQYNRNPTLAKRMFEMRYFESWGQGIDQVLNWAEKQNAKTPIMKDECGLFSITVYSPRHHPQFSTPRTKIHLTQEQQIIDYLKLEGQISNKKCRNVFGLTKTQAQVALRKLKEAGLARQVGSGRSTYYIPV